MQINNNSSFQLGRCLVRRIASPRKVLILILVDLIISPYIKSL